MEAIANAVGWYVITFVVFSVIIFAITKIRESKE